MKVAMREPEAERDKNHQRNGGLYHLCPPPPKTKTWDGRYMSTPNIVGRADEIEKDRSSTDVTC